MDEPTDEHRIIVSYISNNGISQKAQQILDDIGWNDTEPVDIEAIVERHFKLKLIPIPQLKASHGCDSYITSDFRIIVDYDLFINNSPRYRFTLAHELAHYVLHSQAYARLGISDVQTLLDSQKIFTPTILRTIEQQAYRFAGCLLLPERVFAPIVAEVFSDEALSTMTIADAYEAIEEIANRFQVSKDVINKQLRFFHRSTSTALGKITYDI